MAAIRTARQLLAAVCLIAARCHGQVAFYPITAPYQSDLFFPPAMTPSGNVLVGSYDFFITWEYGFSWSAGGVQDAGGFDPNWHVTQLFGISADGRVAVGTSDTSAGNPQFHPNALREVLGSPPEDIAAATAYYSQASAVNADGSVIFGSFSETYTPPVHLFRWRAGVPGWDDLGIVPNTTVVQPRTTTPDGSVVVGTLDSRGFRWSESTGLVVIPPLPGGSGTKALRISADGVVCTGLADSAGQTVIFSQVGTSDPTIARTLPSGFAANDISGDASVAVGYLTSNQHPAFWTAQSGTTDLLTFFVGSGINTSPWSVWYPLTTVSEDGRAMFGSADRTSPPLRDGFVVVPTGPLCYPNCDNSSVPPILNANDFACFMLRFAAQAPYANCDGSTAPPILNANDFQCFLNKFAAGCP